MVARSVVVSAGPVTSEPSQVVVSPLMRAWGSSSSAMIPLGTAAPGFFHS
jgi:hypothetical protein